MTVHPAHSRIAVWYRPLKRVLDFLTAVVLLLLLAPVLLGLAVLIRVTMGGPVIFRQRRAGLGGRVFTMYKFRSMTDARGPDGALQSDAERLTRLGRFLRASSVDELPELFNILVGEMSLIGPRPLLEEYLERYTPEQARRHEVRPGITGWAQVNGRQAITFSTRLALDLWYVDHMSPLLDLRTLLMTFLKVFRSSGVILEQHIDEVDDLGLNSSSALGAQKRAEASEPTAPEA